MKPRALLTAIARATVRILFGALTWLLLFAIGGSVCLIAAAYLSLGPPFALATAGLLCLCGASLIYRGMTRGA